MGFLTLFRKKIKKLTLVQFFFSKKLALLLDHVYTPSVLNRLSCHAIACVAIVLPAWHNTLAQKSIGIRLPRSLMWQVGIHTSTHKKVLGSAYHASNKATGGNTSTHHRPLSLFLSSPLLLIMADVVQTTLLAQIQPKSTDFGPNLRGIGSLVSPLFCVFSSIW